nr:unnamed protein product [Callosobruchus analis]
MSFYSNNDLNGSILKSTFKWVKWCYCVKTVLLLLLPKKKDRLTATTGLSKGGGVLIATKNEYNFEAFHLSMMTLSTPKIDLVGGKIIFGSSMIYVFVVYIPPDTSADDLEVFLDQFVLFNSSHSCSSVLVGHFNVPAFSLNHNNKKHRLLKDFAELCNVKQYNGIFNQNGRLLDLIFSSVSCSSERDDMPLVIEDRHHPAIFFMFHFRVPQIGHRNSHQTGVVMYLTLERQIFH